MEVKGFLSLGLLLGLAMTSSLFEIDAVRAPLKAAAPQKGVQVQVVEVQPAPANLPAPVGNGAAPGRADLTPGAATPVGTQPSVGLSPAPQPAGQAPGNGKPAQVPDVIVSASVPVGPTPVKQGAGAAPLPIDAPAPAPTPAPVPVPEQPQLGQVTPEPANNGFAPEANPAAPDANRAPQDPDAAAQEPTPDQANLGAPTGGNEGAPQPVEAPVLIQGAPQVVPVTEGQSGQTPKQNRGIYKWAAPFAIKKNVLGHGSAATKGRGQIRSVSGWNNAITEAEGSEGSLVNSSHKSNEDSWMAAWSSRRGADGKQKSWAHNFANRIRSSGKSVSAHLGEGSSLAAVKRRQATSYAKGSKGAAVNNNYRRNDDNWSDSWGRAKKDKKGSSFKQTFVVNNLGSSEARGIGHGDSIARGKATVSQSQVEAEGQLGAQGSNRNSYQADEWNNAWGRSSMGEGPSSFQTSFANRINSRGSTQTFGLGNAAVKGAAMGVKGAKSLAKGDQGSGTNSSFKGNKDNWDDSWVNSGYPTARRQKVQPQNPADPQVGEPNVPN